MMRKWTAVSAAALFGLAAATSQAQLLGGVGNAVGGLPGQVTGGLLPGLGGAGAPTLAGGVVDTLSLDRSVGALDKASLLDLRRQRLRALIAANRRTLDADAQGNPVRRDEIVAIDASGETLAAAQRAGFTVQRSERIDGVGIGVTILRPPRGDNPREALDRLKRLGPEGTFELNHIFEPAGGALAASAALLAAAPAESHGGPIGMIDGGVASHPSLAGAAIEQRGFVGGAPKATGHGTAIASLLVGEAGVFRGAATGHRLLAADVYGGDPAAGTATAIASAIGWLSGGGARVATISLVGPPNRLIERAIAKARARGMTIVAAVGNDGPAAPPQYPASYPGVVAVTGVDARGRALIEAGRALHLDFAAPGADMAAALPGRGYAAVRGTSFAAPLVAARLAAANAADPDGRIAMIAREAQPGRGRIGRGIVCGDCRTPPAAVRTKN